MTTTMGATHLAAPGLDPAFSLVSALRLRADAIRRHEMSRLEGRWEGLGDDDRQRLEGLTRRIVDALLREPEDRLLGAADGGADIESARFLFGLDRREPGTG